MGVVGNVAVEDEFGNLITPNKENTQLDIQDLLESIQDLTSQLKFLGSVRGIINDLRVTPVTAGPTQPVSGTVTATVASTTLTGGQTAHSTASTGNPLRVGGRVLPATPDLTLVAGDASDLGITTGQQALFKPYAAGEQDFTFNGTIVNSATAIPFKAAAGASIRNWLTSLTLTSDILATATEVVIRDGDLAGSGVAANVFTTATHDFKIGDQVVFTTINTFTGAVINTPYWVLTVPLATTFTLSASPNGSTLAITGTGTFTIHRVLYRTKLQTTALNPTVIQFPTPLRGAPNAIMSIQGVTASATGTIYYNTAGYVGF